MLRILHLSDFHLTYSSLDDFSSRILKPLIKDLKKHETEKKIDIIAFTGDLVDRGGTSFPKGISEGFVAFEDKVINPIINAFDLPRERFIFVPGNHDIDRALDNKYIESGLTDELDSLDAVDKFIQDGNSDGMKRILPFKDFERNFYSGLEVMYSSSSFESIFRLNVNDISVGIACFNSSWRCYNSETDKEKLLLGDRQITNARKITEACDVKVALMHHSFEWLRPFEAKTVERMISKDYDILLCGHVHEADTWSKTNAYGNIFVSVAPANWTVQTRSVDRTYSNGYAIIDFEPSNKTIKAHHRRYSFPKGEFVSDTDLGDDSGTTEFVFKNFTELRSAEERKDIAKIVRDNHIEEVNTHLLSYSTETSAPKDIETIFVMPDVVKIEKVDPKKGESDNPLSLYELCCSQHNLLILGPRERGKTLLLDRILLELASEKVGSAPLPVLIDFEEFRANRIETTIARFLGISVIQVPSIIQDHGVTLLIDNLSFRRDKSRMLRQLEQFLSTHPHIRVIATCTPVIEGEVPLEIMDYPVISQFMVLNIKPFRTKQIRNLIRTWFSNSQDYDSPERMSKLINFLGTLNIPNTPMALSMFLWIIEKQEDYKPINNALMVENYVERLFKKTSRYESYSEEFDFTNKQSLLTKIAREMFNTSDIDYRLSYRHLRDFVHRHLEIRKFDFSEDSLLQHFLDQGLLVKERIGSEDYVRFRFSCFFQYFLMRNMYIDPDFRLYVLDEANYLYFVEEIEYYTGLNRESTDILNTVIERMNQAYSSLLDSIHQLKFSFDTVFETQRSLASALDTSFVNELSDNKPSSDAIDHMQDELLESMMLEDGIAKKEVSLSELNRLGRIWTLSAIVLKNTEELEIEGMKADAFKQVIACSMAYSVLYKMSLVNYLSKEDDTAESNKPLRREQLELLNKFFPIAHQIMTYSMMGTAKLNVVIQEWLDSNLTKDSVTDLEKFMLVFMYSDLRGKQYQKYVRKLVKHTKRTYIRDMILFKVVSYYFLRSNTPDQDHSYENLIGNIIAESRGGNRDQKGNVIRHYRLAKAKKIREEDADNAG